MPCNNPKCLCKDCKCGDNCKCNDVDHIVKFINVNYSGEKFCKNKENHILHNDYNRLSEKNETLCSTPNTNKTLIIDCEKKPYPVGNTDFGYYLQNWDKK